MQTGNAFSCGRRMPSMEAPSKERASGRATVLVPILGCLLVVLAIPIACSLLIAYSWRDPTPRGPLPDSSTWPEPIRDLDAAMQRSRIDPAGFEVYLVDGQPGSDLSTVICRMPDTAQRFDFLAQKLDLMPVTPGDRWSRLNTEIHNRAPSDWWPDSTASSQLFASRRLIDGDEGSLYFVARDSQHHRIYVRYSFNF